MKKIISLLIILSVLFTLSYVGVNKEEKLAWQEMPDNTNPNLKYFGYYHFARRIPEVAALGNSNFSKVDARNLDEVEELYNNGFMIFIMTRHIFYQNGGIHPDYAEKWETAKTELAPFMDKIIGFYVDEPFVTGKTKEAFHLNCQIVRQDFPEKKMMAVLSIQGLSGADPDYFDYCTDIGYDLYMPWNKNDVLEQIDLMMKKFGKNNQNIWLIPKAFYTITKDFYALVEDRTLAPGDDIIRWIKGSYEIAVADHRIVGIYPFVYDNDGFDLSLRKFMINDNDAYRQDLREIYLQIGKAVINNYD